jgi:hypothetical protein
MVISAELHAQILRYYHVEKWRAGTIARQIGVHRDVVARVLAQSGLPAHGPMQRPMRIDPYLPRASSRWSTASSTTPTSSPSTAIPTVSRRQMSALSSGPVSEGPKACDNPHPATP